MSLNHPSGHFLYSKIFSPVICVGFGVWGTLGSGGQVGGVKVVLRAFPELVEIGPVIRGVKRGHMYKHSLLNI